MLLCWLLYLVVVTETVFKDNVRQFIYFYFVAVVLLDAEMENNSIGTIGGIVLYTGQYLMLFGLFGPCNTFFISFSIYFLNCDCSIFSFYFSLSAHLKTLTLIGFFGPYQAHKLLQWECNQSACATLIRTS